MKNLEINKNAVKKLSMATVIAGSLLLGGCGSEKTEKPNDEPTKEVVPNENYEDITKEELQAMIDEGKELPSLEVLEYNGLMIVYNYDVEYGSNPKNLDQFMNTNDTLKKDDTVEEYGNADGNIGYALYHLKSTNALKVESYSSSVSTDGKIFWWRFGEKSNEEITQQEVSSSNLIDQLNALGKENVSIDELKGKQKSITK